FFAVREATSKAVEHARSGHGPTLLEMQTYRYYGHSKSDKREYRTRDEESAWQARDCIQKLRRALGLDDAAFDALDADVMREVDEAVEFALASPEPEVEDWEAVVYA
ncbi:MAG: thiamine pyrophosphate-dependent enzyme, partial [Armatimonadota bacterium]|nr:thiamine pyrophosphate-dependent enzyme [Armatimonadota bacterium]